MSRALTIVVTAVWCAMCCACAPDITDPEIEAYAVCNDPYDPPPDGLRFEDLPEAHQARFPPGTDHFDVGGPGGYYPYGFQTWSFGFESSDDDECPASPVAELDTMVIEGFRRGDHLALDDCTPEDPIGFVRHCYWPPSRSSHGRCSYAGTIFSECNTNID